MKLKELIFISTLLLAYPSIYSLVDLEEDPDDFVIEAKQILIPGYPHAFNPSLVRCEGKLLMSFRTLLNLKQKFTSTIGLVWLDEEFNIEGEPYLLNFRGERSKAPIRIDDVRLIDIEGKIHLVYSDNPHPVLSRGGFRVYLAELAVGKDSFSVNNIECLQEFPGEDPQRREKNWVPFDFKGQMLLAYSIEPHLIFQPNGGLGTCKELASTFSNPNWDLGELRGGTPALMEDGQYIAFFHSSINMQTVHSEEKIMPHYFMGAYTFDPHPPFKMRQISRRYITAKSFYSGPTYEPYWKPVKVVFPCGLVSDSDRYLVSYGRDDHECWIAAFLKSSLMNSLICVD